MACCWNRPGFRVPVSKDSPFDRLLLEGFARVLRTGATRSSPAAVERRHVEGSVGFVAQFSRDHFSKKRRPEARFASLDVPVDPSAFNFTKADEAERIAVLEDGGSSAAASTPAPREASTTVFASASPLGTGHVIFVPRCEDLLPQALTQDLVLYGLQLLARSTRLDFRILFNSLMGFASVNHCHFHGLYLEYCGVPNMRLPMEKVERSIISGDRTDGRVCIEMLVEKTWHTRAFVLTAGGPAGQPETGNVPAADLEALAALTMGVISELQKRNIPYNMIMAPWLGERRPKKNSRTLGW